MESTVSPQVKALGAAVADLRDYALPFENAGLRIEFLRACIAAAALHRKCLLLYCGLPERREYLLDAARQQRAILDECAAGLQQQAAGHQATILQFSIVSAIAQKLLSEPAQLARAA